MKTSRCLAFLLALGGIRTAIADEPAPRPVPADVQPALAPEESKARIKIAEGLELQLVASEPMVRQPLSITFDDRGRLWVLQYLQYPIPNGLKPVEVDQYLRTKYDRVPEPPPKGPKGADSIIILEDPDGDGRFGNQKTFLRDLHLASGMVLGYDGLYVLQPPYLLYFADKNHDDIPDGAPDVLLSGFGIEDAHALANSLTWGPDGWLYGAQGSTVTARIRGIEFQQGVWRYHPITKEFELFAEGGGNTWGLDFDRHGQLFAGGNTTEPLCHHVQGAYYIKGFSKHGPLHNPYSFGYFNPVKHHGFLGSGLTGGFVIYQADLFPDRFKNAAIYSNLRVNAMRVSRLEPDGSTFDTRFQEDFLVSTDRWFRPVKSLVGPDGALYLADWYDYNISHTDPKDRSKWYIPSRDTGRIWRVVPKGSAPKAAGSWPLRALTSEALIDLLSHPNAWFSREARRILMERRDASVIPRLREMVKTQSQSVLALQALWALHVSGGLDDSLALDLLDHPNEHVRSWVIRLQADGNRVDRRFADRLIALARQEPSVTVRNQLACSCKRLPGAVGLPIVDQLIGRAEDRADPNIPLLLWWAVEAKALSDRDRILTLVATPEAWSRPIAKEVIVERLARRYLAEGGTAGDETCARLLNMAPSDAERERLVNAMEQQMEGQHRDQAPPALAAALKPLLKRDATRTPAAVQLALRLGIPESFALATASSADKARPAEERARFVRTLGEIARPESLDPMLGLLDASEPAPVQAAALDALGRFDSKDVPARVLSHYAKMSPGLREKARDLLVSRPAWCADVLSSVERGQLPASDFSLTQVRRIVLHKDKALDARAGKLWGRVRPATSREKQGRIMAVSQILAKGPGDVARGKTLATKHCLNCHKLFDEGATIGPELTAVDRKNLDVLLGNVFDPSAVIREGYQQFVVATSDGRVLSGLVGENGTETVTVTDAKGNRSQLRRADVDAMTPADSSLMPEGILDDLADQDLRDLFAYLRSEPGSQPTGR